MAAFGQTALVENGARLVSRSDLDLHEKGPTVVAFGAVHICRVYILPRISTAKDVIDLLSNKCCPTYERLVYVVYVRAALAEELGGAQTSPARD